MITHHGWVMTIKLLLLLLSLLLLFFMLLLLLMLVLLWSGVLTTTLRYVSVGCGWIRVLTTTITRTTMGPQGVSDKLLLTKPIPNITSFKTTTTTTTTTTKQPQKRGLNVTLLLFLAIRKTMYCQAQLQLELSWKLRKPYSTWSSHPPPTTCENLFSGLFLAHLQLHLQLESDFY